MNPKRLLIGFALVALALIAILVSLGKPEERKLYEKGLISNEASDSDGATSRASDFKRVSSPPPGTLWLGRSFMNMNAIGQRTPTLPGYAVFYANRAYESFIRGGGGTPEPVPATVTTFDGNRLYAFDDLYEIGQMVNRPEKKTRLSSQGLIAWWYIPSAEKTVLVAASTPRMRTRILASLKVAN